MEKTNTLEKRIKKYAALACGIAGVTSASAQVVYSDVNPDVVLTPSGTAQYSLDLNNDGAIDMVFSMSSNQLTGTFTTSGQLVNYTVDYVNGNVITTSAAPATNGWLGSSSSGPTALAGGVPITSADAFTAGSGSMGSAFDVAFGAPFSAYGYTTASGNFLGTESYVGIRFDVSGATHYGWVRVEMDSTATSMTIKDFAYNSAANAAIGAGEGSGGGLVGINDLSSDVSIRTVGTNLRIELDNASNAEVSLASLTGQVVMNEQMNSSVKVLNLNDLSTGIYLATVATEAGTTTKKIYVK
jgi:hypothetical protein